MNKFKIILCLNALTLAGSSLSMNLWAHAHCGNLQQVKELLDSGVSANEKAWDGGTPLFYAARGGFEEICQLLINRKAEIDAKINNGDTPLANAARSGWTEICQLLLAHDAEVNAKGCDAHSPLMRAALNGNDEVCQILIDAKAEVNAKSDFGKTPLLFAAFNGHEETCKLLINARSQVGIKDNRNATPLMQAASCKVESSRYGHKGICKLLVDVMIWRIRMNNAIALLGMKKFGRAECMGGIDKGVIKLIARYALDHADTRAKFDPTEIVPLFLEIDAIKQDDMRRYMRNYALQELHLDHSLSGPHSPSTLAKHSEVQ